MTDQQTTRERTEDATITDDVRKGRESIAVLPGQGLSPDQMAKLADVALTMAKGRYSIPEFLKGNPGDCFAILNMAVRTNLDPYMISQFTYIQNGRLCLMSVMYHSLAIVSGYLLAPLRDTYEGEGDSLTCTVTGRVRGEPLPYVMQSQPVKALHPGHSAKDGKQFVKGSPLWDKDPKQQLFYHTSRNFVRKYTPLAILGGMVAEDEIDEYIDHEPSPGLVERLSDPERPQTGEGFRDGKHLDQELARIAANEPDEPDEPDEEAPPPEKPTSRARKAITRAMKGRKGIGKAPPKKTHQRAPEPVAKAPKDARREKVAPVGRGQRPKPMPTPKEVKAAADRAEEAPKPKLAKRLPWFDYVELTEQWIAAATDEKKAEERWDMEFDMRDELVVPIKERTRLRAKLDEKIATLK